MSDSVTNYNYVGYTKISVLIKKLYYTNYHYNETKCREQHSGRYMNVKASNSL